jgi:hypothetical protein
MSLSRRALFTLIVFPLVAVFLAGCAGKSQQAGLPMLAMDQLPADVQSAPVTVREAYQFAAANPSLMKQIPCYCGCGAMGHRSNYDCYITSVAADDQITFDNHALGCSICVDITQDVIRLSGQGQTPAQIKSYVDSAYSKYGLSNMP